MKCSLIIYHSLASRRSVHSGYSSGSSETSKNEKNKSWCFSHRAPPPAWLKRRWLIDFHKQTKLPAVVHSSVTLRKPHHSAVILLCTRRPPFLNPATVTITCVKWAPRPASGAWALAGPGTCLRSAVPATLDRMWLINRPVLITGTPLTVVAVTWIPRRGDSKLQGKCNGFCYIATHCDSELHQRPDVITCPQDAGSVFYDDYSENQVSAQIVRVFASVAPVLSIMSIQRGNKGMQQVVHFTCRPLQTSVS